MRTAWFNCCAGVAGDMVLGSLIDAGAPTEQVIEQLESLGIDGWSIEIEPVTRSGIQTTRANVRAKTAPSRTLPQILSIIDRSRLAPRAKQRATLVFRRLAAAEATVHGIEIERVHFHEVGAVDAIIDICGTCIALELLDIDSIGCSSIAVGSGSVRASHGLLPNPAPAVVEMLEGFPMHGIDTPSETSTPTGVALMTGLADQFGVAPTFGTLDGSGYGAGSRDLEGIVNATQVLVGAKAMPEPERGGIVIETNVDDATGEVLANTITQLLDAGARDAWLTPIVMKKGRPAYTVSVLCSPLVQDELVRMLVSETGTFGVRTYQVDRHPVARRMSAVDIKGTSVRVKHGPHRTKAEFDDVIEAAAQTRQPVRDVLLQVDSAVAKSLGDSE